MSQIPKSLPVLPPQVRREDLKPGEVLCTYCTAKCCKYFALPIDTPTTHKEFDYLRWYLLHERAALFTEGKTWYLLVHTHCKHLQSDNRCGIYDTRPQICRKYSTKNCEYDDTYVYERYLETSEQVAEYAEAVLQPAGKNKVRRSPQPPLLPIVG